MDSSNDARCSLDNQSVLACLGSHAGKCADKRTHPAPTLASMESRAPNVKNSSITYAEVTDE
jgi:hypothetical protein